jgi:hypothetical protein
LPLIAAKTAHLENQCAWENVDVVAVNEGAKVIVMIGLVLWTLIILVVLGIFLGDGLDKKNVNRS